MTAEILLPPFEKWRTELGISLRRVELQTGIDKSHIHKIETGKLKNPSYKTVKKLLNFYADRGITEESNPTY